MVHAASDAATVPVAGLLALIIAESGLKPNAERWGGDTRHAAILLERIDAGANGPTVAELQSLALTEWPDISFGYSQRIVEYHWYGDYSSRLDNILAVRKAVFNNPARDVLEAAFKLSGCIASAPGQDIMEGLMIYNFGHYVPPAQRGAQFKANWANYASALQEAEGILNVN